MWASCSILKYFLKINPRSQRRSGHDHSHQPHLQGKSRNNPKMASKGRWLSKLWISTQWLVEWPRIPEIGIKYRSTTYTTVLCWIKALGSHVCSTFPLCGFENDYDVKAAHKEIRKIWRIVGIFSSWLCSSHPVNAKFITPDILKCEFTETIIPC